MIHQNSPTTMVQRLANVLLQLLILAVAVWLLHVLQAVLVPFVVALLLAYLLNPVVLWVQKGLRWRGLSVAATLLLIVLVLGGVCWLVVPMVGRDFQESLGAVSQLLDDNSKLSRQLDRIFSPQLVDGVQHFLQEIDVKSFLGEYKDFSQLMLKGVQKLIPQLWGVVTGALTLLGVAFQVGLALVYLLFLLFDPKCQPHIGRRSVAAGMIFTV